MFFTVVLTARLFVSVTITWSHPVADVMWRQLSHQSMLYWKKDMLGWCAAFICCCIIYPSSNLFCFRNSFLCLPVFHPSPVFAFLSNLIIAPLTFLFLSMLSVLCCFTFYLKFQIETIWDFEDLHFTLADKFGWIFGVLEDLMWTCLLSTNEMRHRHSEYHVHLQIRLNS